MSAHNISMFGIMVVSLVGMRDSEREDIGSGHVLNSDDSSEHQQWSSPRPKMSKKRTGAATYLHDRVQLCSL